MHQSFPQARYSITLLSPPQNWHKVKPLPFLEYGCCMATFRHAAITKKSLHCAAMKDLGKFSLKLLIHLLRVAKIFGVI